MQHDDSGRRVALCTAAAGLPGHWSCRPSTALKGADGGIVTSRRHCHSTPHTRHQAPGTRAYQALNQPGRGVACPAASPSSLVVRPHLWPFPTDSWCHLRSPGTGASRGGQAPVGKHAAAGRWGRVRGGGAACHQASRDRTGHGHTEACSIHGTAHRQPVLPAKGAAQNTCCLPPWAIPVHPPDWFLRTMHVSAAPIETPTTPVVSTRMGEGKGSDMFKSPLQPQGSAAGAAQRQSDCIRRHEPTGLGQDTGRVSGPQKPHGSVPAAQQTANASCRHHTPSSSSQRSNQCTQQASQAGQCRAAHPPAPQRAVVGCGDAAGGGGPCLNCQPLLRRGDAAGRGGVRLPNAAAAQLAYRIGAPAAERRRHRGALLHCERRWPRWRAQRRLLERQWFAAAGPAAAAAAAVLTSTTLSCLLTL